ncbi:hypothetical protein UA08_04760 [Talaromyces atroroseus]|uniref:Uncharacterized protein n=1 Tax=Talaromyces atroroseus TaxID=1441469 RepID=A0A225AK62_TALAT|nr:hypothetical protein UA08_04760 [Talaromyces atroroseus]OKL59773.1 hypothetical protein UA08_04760 [Talaromyces atroroseus]
MRYLTRLNVLGSFAFIGVLIALSLLYASGNFYTVGSQLHLPETPSSPEAIPEPTLKPPSKPETTKVPITPVKNSTISSKAENRLVVFGDAWSDTGSRLADQGRAWPEWFCMMWPCRLETYAQKEHVCKSSFCGSVVDETELHTVETEVSRALEPLPDLRSQVDQWLAAEIRASENEPAAGDMQARAENTVFALSFLIWDIWKFNGAHPGDAQSSINRSLTTMFQQLDRLAEHTKSDDLKILLMMSVDPTLLPAFDPSQGQKDMVSIVDQWNTELKEQADEWKNGSVYVFNTNEFLSNQIRSGQFFMAGMLDGQGLGKENPWDDVENPCVQTTSHWLPFLNNKGQRCERPEKFLFWYVVHKVTATGNKEKANNVNH